MIANKREHYDNGDRNTKKTNNKIIMKMVTEIPIPAHICTELRMLHRISSVAFGVPERISYIYISYNSIIYIL